MAIQKNLKELFFRVVRSHFWEPSNQNRLATAFLGSACEQWVNGELFQSIVGAAPTLWCRPERFKGDLVLFSDEDESEPEVVLETKLLYASESHAKQRDKLHVLCEQIRKHQTRFPSAQVAGLVLAFDWDWADVRISSDWTKPRQRSKAPGLLPRPERLSVGAHNAFGHSAGARLLSKHPVAMGAYQYRVTCSIEMIKAR